MHSSRGHLILLIDMHLMQYCSSPLYFILLLAICYYALSPRPFLPATNSQLPPFTESCCVSFAGNHMPFRLRIAQNAQLAVNSKLLRGH
jgi:hypothetical protein